MGVERIEMGAECVKSFGELETVWQVSEGLKRPRRAHDARAGPFAKGGYCYDAADGRRIGRSGQ